jgi:hypothetical protein
MPCFIRVCYKCKNAKTFWLFIFLLIIDLRGKNSIRSLNNNRNILVFIGDINLHFFKIIGMNIAFIGEMCCYKSCIDLPKFFLYQIQYGLCKNPETRCSGALANFQLSFSTLC